MIHHFRQPPSRNHPVKNLFQQAIFLKRAVHPRRGLKFFLAGMMGFRATNQWIQYFDESLSLITNDRTRAEFLTRIHRPMNQNYWSLSQRVDALIVHYRLLLSHLNQSDVKKILSSGTINICHLTPENKASANEDYYITIGRVPHYTKEGELTFSFWIAGNQQFLASITGTFVRQNNGMLYFSVGGMQGAKHEKGRDDIIHASRALSGLRPKSAVLEAACAFASRLGASELRLASRKTHVFGGMKWWRRRIILASYDSFWEERGATKTIRGDYCLPLPLKSRSVEEISTKQRKLWVKRQKHLTTIVQGIENLLQN